MTGSAETVVCPHCAKSTVAAIVCMHCRGRLSSRPAVDSAEKGAPMLRRPWVVWLAVAGAIGGAAFAYQQSTSERRQAAPYRAAATDAATTSAGRRPARPVATSELDRAAMQSLLKPSDALMARWIDAVKLASATPKLSLAGQVSALQTIRREAQELTVPPCLADGKAAMVGSMSHTIDAFLAFMRSGSAEAQGEAEADLQTATTLLAKYSESRLACLR